MIFDPLPPPSSEPLCRHLEQQDSRLESQEESSDAGEAYGGHEGSANVERLMQNYYTALIADVDQAAKRHARMHVNGCSRGDDAAGDQDGPSDSGAMGGSVAPYYFDPFSADNGDASRRGHQGTGGAWSPSAATPSATTGAPNGSASNQGTTALAARTHPMLSAAAEKVRGVAFCKSNRYWICTRMEHGKQQCRRALTQDNLHGLQTMHKTLVVVLRCVGTRLVRVALLAWLAAGTSA